MTACFGVVFIVIIGFISVEQVIHHWRWFSVVVRAFSIYVCISKASLKSLLAPYVRFLFALTVIWWFISWTISLTEVNGCWLMTTCGHLSHSIPLCLFGFIRFYCNEDSSSLMAIWSFPYYLDLSLCPTLLFCLSQFITKLTSSIYLILLIINSYDLRRFIIWFSSIIFLLKGSCKPSKVFKCKL